MIISMIAAIDRHGLIGDANGLPWHLPKDLKRFRALTWAKPIIMGRRTFELLGKPLPGRCNIVLSQDARFSASDCRVARNTQEALDRAKEFLASAGGEEMVIIGGSAVYREFMRCWDRMYLTVVEGEFQGTVLFPLGDLLREKWRPAVLAEVHSPDDKNRYRHSFHVLQREPVDGSTGLQSVEDWQGLDLEEILARGTAAA